MRQHDPGGGTLRRAQRTSNDAVCRGASSMVSVLTIVSTPKRSVLQAVWERQRLTAGAVPVLQSDSPLVVPNNSMPLKQTFSRSFTGYSKLIVLLVLAVAVSSVANANAISNSGFESGLTGWTTNPSYAWTSTAQDAIFGSYDARNGYGYNCGPTNCLDPTVGAYLYQDFSTIVGDTYTISFEYYFGGTNGLQEIEVYFAGGMAANISTTSNVPAWTLDSFNDVATSTTTRLEFTQVNLPDYTYLDNVSVVVTPTTVPEPAGWTLMVSAIAGLLLVRRQILNTKSLHVCGIRSM